mmetsp:Transcript_36952/g.81118  ORF Transcript_36952/g.81118 Transcript_36952/m.81118 type:complete len:588 (-) Transcript_36952:164-1927(-)
MGCSCCTPKKEAHRNALHHAVSKAKRRNELAQFLERGRLAEEGTLDRSNSSATSGICERYLDAVLQRFQACSREAVVVAILGAQGVGKSSLINALRNLPHEHPQAAPVGVTETTVAATSYKHRFEEASCRVVFLDSPGRDASRLEAADVVLIVTSGRFTTFDRDLVSMCREHRKPFYLVRTKVDLDVFNETLAKPWAWKTGLLSEVVVLDRIRTELCQNIRELLPEGHRNCRHFMVNSQTYGRSACEMHELRQSIARSLPHAKRLELLRVAPLMSAEIVESKREALLNELRVWTTFSTLICGMQPIPVLGSTVSWGWLCYWRDQLALEFGCNDVPMRRLFDRLVVLGVDAEEVCKIRDMSTYAVMNDFIETAQKTASQMRYSETMNAFHLIPGVTDFAAGLASVALMRWAVKTMVDSLADFTLQLQQLLLDAMGYSYLGFEITALDAEQRPRRLCLSADGELLMSESQNALQLRFQANEKIPGTGRLLAQHDPRLSLCIVTLGTRSRLCLCLSGDKIASRRATWRRRPLLSSEGRWMWTFDVAGTFLVSEGADLRLVPMDVELLGEVTSAHFQLQAPQCPPVVAHDV